MTLRELRFDEWITLLLAGIVDIAALLLVAGVLVKGCS
jgi:hypothetical protein